MPVVAVQERRDQPGGAANTAANLAALGCQVELLSVVGSDAEGRLLREILRARGVGIEAMLTQAGRRTLAKQRVMAGSQLVVRFDQGDTEPVDVAAERCLSERLASTFARVDAVVVSDYGYGIVTPAIVEQLAALQARRSAVVAVDARDLLAYRGAGVTLVKPNYDEAIRLLGPRLAGGHRSRAEIAEMAGTNAAGVDRHGDRGGHDGPRRRRHRRAGSRAAPDLRRAGRAGLADGAGDTFIAAFALALAAGGPTPVAADLAAAAASVVVARDGTATCTADDVRRAVFSAVGRPYAGLAVRSDHDGTHVPSRSRASLPDDEERADDVADLGERRTPALRPA